LIREKSKHAGISPREKSKYGATTSPRERNESLDSKPPGISTQPSRRGIRGEQEIEESTEQAVDAKPQTITSAEQEVEGLEEAENMDLIEDNFAKKEIRFHEVYSPSELLVLDYLPDEQHKPPSPRKKGAKDDPWTKAFRWKDADSKGEICCCLFQFDFIFFFFLFWSVYD
jgi:hypothetical protein